ncbi:hypothetical protein EPN83_02870 [Patescibacteria group bacterium]|nr:MAG: hypothetical protein EPN83_02870 [Patescibacteria group bacterium]
MNYLALARPQQWIKNLLIFASAFFSGMLFSPSLFLELFAVFGLFSLTASAGYALNDALDYEFDRTHKSKGKRPVASGEISKRNAVYFSLIIFAVSITLVLRFFPDLSLLFLIYFVLNILYSALLKKIVVVDLLVFPVFFLIRILIGAEVVGVGITSWLILCTIFLSLFLVIAKRVSERRSAAGREVLNFYSEQFLSALLITSATLSIVAFALYTVLAYPKPALVYSNIFVVGGIFRYFFLVFSTNKAEEPEAALVHDRWLFAIVLGWVIYLFFVFY